MSPRAAIAVGATTAGFAIALALRDRYDPWQTTAAAGVAGIALARWALGSRARVLLATSWVSALRGLGLGVLLVIATHVVFRVATAWLPQVTDEVRQLYASIAVDYGRLPLVGLTLVVVLAEELVWRGAALELVAGRPRWVGALGVGLYALPQLLAGVWLLALSAIVLGTLLVTQRLLTGRITEPLITHAVWSVAIFVVVPLG